MVTPNDLSFHMGKPHLIHVPSAKGTANNYNDMWWLVAMVTRTTYMSTS